MDHELTLWSQEEAVQKLARIAEALEEVIQTLGDERDIPKSLPAGSSKTHAIPNMMNQFEVLRSVSSRAREKNYAASILPGEALRLDPDKLEENGFLEDTFCPFLLLGDRDYSVGIDREAYVRWSIGAFTEQVTYGFFTEERFKAHGLSSKQVKDFTEATMIKSPFMRYCFE